MAFWSDVKWKSLTESQYPVKPFDPSRLEEAGYQLAIGREVYISAPGGESRIHQLTEKEAFALKPGQFAFILTEEEVRLPLNVIGFITIRASVKFYGLVNVSGFHVDPGYIGKLIFAVFNAGPTNIHLRQGEQIFCMWLSDLDQAISRTSPKEGYQNIPSRVVNQVSGDFLTAYELVERIELQHSELLKLRGDVESLKAFNFRMKVVAALIGMAFVILFRGLIIGWIGGAYSEIKEQFFPADGTEAQGTTAAPSTSGDRPAP